MQNIILPPQCLGVMGGGQLARMFAISAKQMGYKVAILDPDLNCPAKQFADYHITTAYTDKDGLDQLAKIADVISTEFENVPADSLQYLSKSVPVYPAHTAVKITQNRLAEKQFFNHNQIATTRYYSIDHITDIKNITLDIFPGILKTNTLGYDGKGQIVVSNVDELEKAFIDLNKVPCILEKRIDLKLEASVIVARNSSEKIAYPVVENIHKNGILELTIAPARIDSNLAQTITNMGLTIIEKLDYIGILAIEFFISKDNKIFANEMAPRPHNSGHYTIDACITSQFEQQLRAMCNLKLGQTDLQSNAIMLGLLGDIWQDEHTHPDWQILTKHNNLKLHLYEKQLAKPSRKMGHLTILGNDIEKLYTQIKQIKSDLNI